MIQSHLLRKYSVLTHGFFGITPEDVQALAAMITVTTAQQVHGASLAVLDVPGDMYPGVDGLLLSQPGRLSIRTADCLPILFYDQKRETVAAIHAGWKGLALGIIPATIRLLVQQGSRPEDMVVAIGPHVRRRCYPVSADRVQTFVSQGLSETAIARRTNDQWYLDLEEIAATQLRVGGIATDALEIIPVCTRCDQRFASYRRDPKETARNYAVIEHL